MKTLTIIGGIGSGKSTVSRFLSEYGTPVLDLDTVGHEVLFDPTVKASLIETFGPTILDVHGEIDRKVLAAKAFASEASTQQLTALTSPAILSATEQWLAEQEEQGQACVILEISAFDGPDGFYSHLVVSDFDFLLIAVVAPVELRAQRAQARGFDPDDIRRRIARQATDTERRAWADQVIDNSGTEAELQTAVENLWRTIND